MNSNVRREARSGDLSKADVNVTFPHTFAHTYLSVNYADSNKIDTKFIVCGSSFSIFFGLSVPYFLERGDFFQKSRIRRETNLCFSLRLLHRTGPTVSDEGTGTSYWRKGKEAVTVVSKCSLSRAQHMQ